MSDAAFAEFSQSLASFSLLQLELLRQQIEELIFKAQEKTVVSTRLMAELATGRQSGEEHGWLSEESVRSHFAVRL